MTTDRHRACDGARSPVGLRALQELAETYRPSRDAALCRQQLAVLRQAVLAYCATDAPEPHWPADGSGDELDGGYDPTAYLPAVPVR